MSGIQPEQRAETTPPPPVMPPQGPFAAPPQYAGYTRANQTGGSPEKLEALGSGYFGLNWVFLFHFLWLTVGMVTIVATTNGSDLGSGLAGIFYLLTLVLIPFIGYRQVKKIGFGMGWSSVLSIIFSALLGVVGIIMYIVLQMSAASEIGRYGIRRSFMGGFKRKDIAAAVAAMKASPYYQSQQNSGQVF